MTVPRTAPVIIGVGEVCNKSQDVKNAIEPADLMLKAIRNSIEDTSQSANDILPHVDSVSVVPPWTWPYPDLPATLAEKLGVEPSHLTIGSHGGNQPALLCDEAARRVSRGQSKVAIVTGGEALASLAACQKAGKMPPPGWSKPDLSRKPVDPSDLSAREQNVGSRHSMGLPIHVYPMYEHGFRKKEHQTPEKNTKDSAELYAAFDEVACRCDYSWRFGAQPREAAAIGRVSEKNRMICTPYPLLMNAFNTVNLAAACIVTTADFATSLGVPEENWVYVLGGAGTDDSSDFWERPNYFSSPALEHSIDAAIASSKMTIEELDCFDIYSCFPIVPKLACKHLGLDVVKPRKPITVLGGLTSFGGAGNNYSMHAITEMTRQMRKGVLRNGLVLANGGVLTYQHAICLSTMPRKDQSDYPKERPLPPQLEGTSRPSFTERAEGAAEIETYTVEFDRRGGPRIGLIVGRLRENGHRFIANQGDEPTLTRLANTEVESIGLQGTVTTGADGRNLFHLHSDAKL